LSAPVLLQQWVWIVAYPDEIAWWLHVPEGEKPEIYREAPA
jgi:hypothetical protein